MNEKHMTCQALRRNGSAIAPDLRPHKKADSSKSILTSEEQL